VFRGVETCGSLEAFRFWVWGYREKVQAAIPFVGFALHPRLVWGHLIESGVLTDSRPYQTSEWLMPL
jgi:hypothetical protein